MERNPEGRPQQEGIPEQIQGLVRGVGSGWGSCKWSGLQSIPEFRRKGSHEREGSGVKESSRSAQLLKESQRNKGEQRGSGQSPTSAWAFGGGGG